ncbi:hypothetical protein [Amycolatopsis sp. MEPSY49]|uniref:hypothetical protein n=1 Tax=Amycolatopsis sp. MEPSY49 TaxID=3151600 RepID=UPI003EF1AB4A
MLPPPGAHLREHELTPDHAAEVERAGYPLGDDPIATLVALADAVHAVKAG